MPEQNIPNVIICLLFTVNCMSGYYVHKLISINRRLTIRLNRRSFIQNNPVVNADPIITIVAEEV